MEEQRESTPEAAEVEKSFLKYTFFKVAREWRSLDDSTKEESRREFLRALGDSSSSSLSFFSLVGIRGDTDFMILADSPSLDSFQTFVARLLSTKLGRYLEIPYSYLAMTRRSKYLGSHRRPGQEGTLQQYRSSKFLFVYPFVKKREWYRLPFAERQRIMAEHFKIGHKYPSIKINTGYSFGLDDQEFVLAFDGDDPAEFLSLVEELRSSEASMYTQLETPIFTCRRVDPTTMLSLLG
ncbi:MAG: chlorite dismutase family protein [Nitrososphaerales archaeon]|nr:chlorite dismutase family protein [Nitrososphaerales archaeon]